MTEMPKRRPGAYDPTLSIRTPIVVKNGLQDYAASRGMTVSKAGSFILEGFLRTHGWLLGSEPKSEDPAVSDRKKRY